MKKTIIFVLALTIVLSFSGCEKPKPEGVVRQLIDKGHTLDNHLYYRETRDGQTAIYRIAETTSDISCILSGLTDVRAVKSSETSVYILRDDRLGNMYITRLEGNRSMTTDAYPETSLKAMTGNPWDVSRNDRVFVAGVDEGGNSHIIELSFERKEAERTFKENEVLVPTILFEQRDWYNGSSLFGKIDASADGETLGITLPLNDDSGKYGIYFINDPGGNPVQVDDRPVVETGGFSSDGSKYLATLELPQRIDLFMFDTASLEAKTITRVATGFEVLHPVWHPNGKYIIYTTDYTTEIRSNSTLLSGDQIFLYSLVSDNDRRLTAFQGLSLWADFSPTGSFLLYASSPGVIARGGRGIPQEGAEIDPNLETWRMSFVPWEEDQFVTGNIRIMNADEIEFLISWTNGGRDLIEFFWGPHMQGL